jgi:DNA-binding CsgD family transcriptional regulator/N-acetylneuraminic acid mutarotase
MAEYGEPLSQREREVLELVATGMTNRQIAQALVVSPNTIKVHLRKIFTKLGVESRTEATLTAIREGWVSVPTEKEAPTETVETAPSVEEPVTIPDRRPTLAPLPWPKRLALVGFLLIVTLISIATWQRSPKATGTIIGPEPPVTQVPPPEPESKWQALAPMLKARMHFALVATGGKLFAIGGHTKGGITGAVERYDPAEDRWTTLNASKPTRVSHIGAAAIDGQIYVPGGWTAQKEPTAVVERYDLANETWDQVASLPRPLLAYALAVHKGKIYLFGGKDERGYANTTYIYDPEADDWRKGQEMSTPRAYAAAATIGARIFVIGGYDGQREQSTCEVYSPEEDSWEGCEPLTQGRGGFGLASVGNRLYVIGGGWTNYLGFSEEYDPKYNTRKFFGTPVSRQWRNLAVASIPNKKFYVAGGWNGDYLDNVWEYVVLKYDVFIPAVLP